METGIRVAVVAIVILIVALVTLAIFTGGMQRIVEIINSWFGNNEDPCDVACNVWKTTCTEPKPYREFPGCENKAGDCPCTRQSNTQTNQPARNPVV